MQSGVHNPSELLRGHLLIPIPASAPIPGPRAPYLPKHQAVFCLNLSLGFMWDKICTGGRHAKVFISFSYSCFFPFLFYPFFSHSLSFLPSPFFSYIPPFSINTLTPFSLARSSCIRSFPSLFNIPFHFFSFLLLSFFLYSVPSSSFLHFLSPYPFIPVHFHSFPCGFLALLPLRTPDLICFPLSLHMIIRPL